MYMRQNRKKTEMMRMYIHITKCNEGKGIANALQCHAQAIPKTREKR